MVFRAGEEGFEKGDGDEGAKVPVLGVQVEGRKWEAVLVMSEGTLGERR